MMVVTGFFAIGLCRLPIRPQRTVGGQEDGEDSQWVGEWTGQFDKFNKAGAIAPTFSQPVCGLLHEL